MSQPKIFLDVTETVTNEMLQMFPVFEDGELDFLRFLRLFAEALVCSDVLRDVNTTEFWALVPFSCTKEVVKSFSFYGVVDNSPVFLEFRV